MYKVHRYLKNEFDLGEGPHWEKKSQTLLTVDITRSAVVRWDPASPEKSKQTLVPDEDASVGAVVPIIDSDDLLVCSKRRFATVNETSGEVKDLLQLEPDKSGSKFNDGKCDASGRFIAGTMGKEKSPGDFQKNAGRLYSLERDGTLQTLINVVDLSNGLAWTSDSRTMFYIDSLKFCVNSYDYNISNGSMSNEKVVVKFSQEEGFPDGMCIDANGDIYVAIYYGGKVVKINPTTGKRIQEIKIDNCPIITSACFGGPNYEDLYVTSAHNNNRFTGTDKPAQDSGSLFKVTGLGVKGLPAVNYSPTYSKV